MMEMVKEKDCYIEMKERCVDEITKMAEDIESIWILNQIKRFIKNITR